MKDDFQLARSINNFVRQLCPRGITIDINLTHRDLGHLVNASRVMVTKIMGDLKQEGAITTQGNRISLINREKLANSLEAV